MMLIAGCGRFGAADAPIEAAPDAGGDSAAVTPTADSGISTDVDVPDSGACGDTTTSREHCGSCGHACAAQEACDRGTCVLTSCATVAAAILHPTSDLLVPPGWTAPGGGALHDAVDEVSAHDGDATSIKNAAAASADLNDRLTFAKSPLPADLANAKAIRRVLVNGVFRRVGSVAVDVTIGMKSGIWKTKYDDAFLNTSYKAVGTDWMIVSFDRTDQAYGNNAPWSLDVVDSSTMVVETRASTFPIDLRLTKIWMEVCYE